jgi:hypothetical protein
MTSWAIIDGPLLEFLAKAERPTEREWWALGLRMARGPVRAAPSPTDLDRTYQSSSIVRLIVRIVL